MAASASASWPPLDREPRYVSQEKRFVGKRPQTRIFRTDQGRRTWLARMDAIMRAAE